MCVVKDDVLMGLFSSVFYCKITWWDFFLCVGLCLLGLVLVLYVFPFCKLN